MSKCCPHCGKESNEESPRFCSGCGARMDGSIPAGYLGYAVEHRGYYTGPPRPQKSMMVAGGCSTILPGLGQVYNGETAKGFALFILTLAGLVILLIPGLIVWLYAMYDAYSVAGKMNSGEVPSRETRTVHMVLFIVFALIVIVAILIMIMMAMSSLMSQVGTLDTGNYHKLFESNGLF